MSVSVSQLANGLTVITESIDYVETAVVSVWVDVGSRHEVANNQGISHFLEHMAFKGTERRNARQIAEEIESVGGQLNASTGSEHTIYHVSVLKEDVALSIDILGDILTGSTFDLQELKREQKVVIQEISAVHDTPDDLVFDLFLEAAYPQQPLGRSILGTPETISLFTPQRLREYLTSNYRGPNIVLCAVGAVSHDDILALVTQHMGTLPMNRGRDAIQAVYHGGERRLERDLEQSQFVIGFPAPCYYDPDIYAARLLAVIMGGGMSSRLFQEIREVRGLCYCVSAFCWSYRDTGIFGIHAATGPQDLPELIMAVLQEVQRAALDIGKHELARARQQVKAGLMMSLESLAVRAERMSRQMLLFGKVIPVSEMVQQLELITVDQIRALASSFCSNAAPTLAVVGAPSDLVTYNQIVSRLKQSDL